MRVPVLDRGAPGGEFVELGTGLAVLLGFVWVVWKMWGASRGVGSAGIVSADARKGTVKGR